MAKQGITMVRYADDFVILCRSEAAARGALEDVRRWVQEVGLRLHPEKTRMVDATQRGGFDFLGYHFERGYKWPSTKSTQKLKTAVRERTRRTNGTSLEMILSELNPTLRGWFTYFRYSHPTTFPRLDR